MVESIIFIALSLVAVAAGIAVFRTDSMARATYALAVSFVAVGLILLQFRLEYIGVITVLMMVMEMAIMAIFMVMFMGMNPALMPMDMVHNKKTSAGIALGVFLLLAAGILLVDWPVRRGAAAPDLTAALGEALMGPKMLVMLVISPVLFTTIVAATVLANPRGRYRTYPAAPADTDQANDGDGTRHGQHAGDRHDGDQQAQPGPHDQHDTHAQHDQHGTRPGNEVHE